MKKHNLKIKPNLRPKGNFGKIGKKMYWEPDEKPTVDRISRDYSPQVKIYIEADAYGSLHEEESGISNVHWRIG